MTGIPVSVVPPTPEGRLYPQYQNRIGVLTLSTNTPGKHRFGINIDGSLILDFDESGVLASVELLLPMSRWKGRASTSPPGGAAGNLLLPAPQEASANYEWSVTVSKNVQTDAARIGLGNGDYNRSVRLSETCYGLLFDGRLTGFWFTLSR